MSKQFPTTFATSVCKIQKQFQWQVLIFQINYDHNMQECDITDFLKWKCLSNSNYVCATQVSNIFDQYLKNEKRNYNMHEYYNTFFSKANIFTITHYLRNIQVFDIFA